MAYSTYTLKTEGGVMGLTDLKIIWSKIIAAYVTHEHRCVMIAEMIMEKYLYKTH